MKKKNLEYKFIKGCPPSNHNLIWSENLLDITLKDKVNITV